MPATEREVQAAAKLARIGVDDARIATATAPLRAALARLEPLRHARTDIRGGAIGVGAGGMPLRADAGPPYAMSRPALALAAASRRGYVLVPRLGASLASDRPPTPGAPPHGSAPAAGTPNDSAPNNGASNNSAPDVLGDDVLAAELDLGA